MSRLATADAEDLALYALHLLDGCDEQRMHTLLRQSAEARDELQDLYRGAAALSLSVEPVGVPISTRQRFLSAVARDPKPVHSSAVPVPEDVSRPKPGLLLQLLPWSGWAVAAGLAVTTALYRQHIVRDTAMLAESKDALTQAQVASTKAERAGARAQAVLDALRSRSAQRYVLTAHPGAPAPSAAVTYVSSSGSVLFQGNHLQSLPAAKTYELWLIPADKAAKPIPAGTFKPDVSGYASLILPKVPRGVAAATFGVTVESDGGSSTPTLPILLTGA